MAKPGYNAGKLYKEESLVQKELEYSVLTNQ
jgi:hypothetical protein